MRSLVYLIATTLDGYVAGADRGNPEFFPVTGPHMADLLAEFPEIIPVHARPFFADVTDWDNKRFDVCLMGRTTWELGVPFGVVSPYPQLRQIVFSTTLTELPANDLELVGTDPVATVRELKAQEGRDIWLCGGGKLAATLADEIDEFVLKVNPVLHGGGGAPLLDALPAPRAVVPTGLKAYDNGFQLARYRWA